MAIITADDIRYYYSGGAANANAAASLGGIISATRVLAQSFSSPINVTGMVIANGSNNQQGNGILSWSPGTNAIGWKSPGSAATNYLSGITTNGTYTVGDSAGSITVTVTVASLPSTYKQDTISVTNTLHNVFAGVTALQSLLGNVAHRCLYVKNTHPTTPIINTKLWIKALSDGPDEIEVGLDPAGINGTATVIGTEGAAPAGVVFSSPLSYATGLNIGTLNPGQSIAFWERRTVPQGSVGNIAYNHSAVAVAFDV